MNNGFGNNRPDDDDIFEVHYRGNGQRPVGNSYNNGRPESNGYNGYNNGRSESNGYNGYNNGRPGSNGYNSYRNGYYDPEKERREARAAGNRALASLQRAKAELKNAKGWGMWDMFGGGIISTYAKHNKMDNAKMYMQMAKNDMLLFQRELRDVTAFENLNIETNDFLGMADFFFDGLIADIMMQNRINEAIRKVDRAIIQIQNILPYL